MTMRARKLLIYAVIAALAVANGIAPRLAHAANQQAVADSITAGHHQHHGQVLKRNVDAVPCQHEGTSDFGKFQSDHNCCAAACAAVAFIFTTVGIDRQVPGNVFDPPPVSILHPDATFSIDRPPRLA